MKKAHTKIKNLSVKELVKEIQKLRLEIAKEKLSSKVNAPKDTNSVYKKRKNLAVHLTVLTEKQELEVLQKAK